MLNKLLSKQNRALLFELVRTDFKLRYQGSAIGYSWSLLKPLFMFVILYVVFAVVFKVGKGVPNFPIYLLLGIILWNFFLEMTQQGLGAIVARGDLIRKIRIPRWLIIVSVSFSAVINLSLNLVVVFVLAIINDLHFSSGSLLLLFFIIEIYLLSLGISLILASLFVKYRDVSYIWDVLTQAGFYLTPILYPMTINANMITNIKVQKLLYINPLAQAIQGARNVFVTSETLTVGEVWGSKLAVFIPFFIILLTIVCGVLYFKKEAPNFAENL